MRTDKHIDTKLVEAYQSGNKEALAGLVKRWHLLFCKKAFWIVKDADLSKDIAQESWQTIMNKIDTLKDTSSFGAWALRIVYSKSLDVIRKSTKERLKKDVYIKEQPSETDEEIDNTELKVELLKNIRALPINQQHVIRLFYVEDYSLLEIGDLLEISVGTVKSRLFHAREKLKQTLKHKHYENL